MVVISFPHLRKYSPSGEILWDKEINFGLYNGCGIEVDRGDSIIVGGYGEPTYPDSWVIMKYTPDGESLWKRLIGIPDSGMPIFSDLGIDNQNNIFVTGDWRTYKLSNVGNTVWIRIFNSNWGYDWSTGVCADDSLDVIVAGMRGIYGIPRSWYPQVYKYSAQGDSIWANYYYDTICHNHNVGEITVDKIGNIILPGEAHRWIYAYAFLFKYDPLGNLLWTWFDDSTAGTGFHSCITDSLGFIFTSGVMYRPNDTILLVIKKFKPDGESLWSFSKFLGYIGVSEHYQPKILLDQTGDLLVATNEDTFVYVFKISNPNSISENKYETREYDNITSIIVSKRNFRINLSLNVNTINIYAIDGRLITKITQNRVKNVLLNCWDIKALTEGVYFLDVKGKIRKTIKMVLMN